MSQNSLSKMLRGIGATPTQINRDQDIKAKKVAEEAAKALEKQSQKSLYQLPAKNVTSDVSNENVSRTSFGSRRG